MESLLERLQQSDASVDEADEELELEALKQQAVLQLRENEDREKAIRALDLTISLLIKNRLSLEDIAADFDLTGPSAAAAASGDGAHEANGGEDSNNQNGNGLRSTSGSGIVAPKSLALYQHLFFLLQTEPRYLAKLIHLHKGAAEMQKFIGNIVLSLFGFAQDTREEFLLLSLFKTAIQEEMADIEEPQAVLVSNPIILDLLVKYSRTANEHSFLVKLLRPLVLSVIDVPELDLDLDPISIYYNTVATRETKTGEKSSSPYEVNAVTALEDPEVREVLSKNMSHLLKIADKFITAFFAAISLMPLGIRFIASELYHQLNLKFSDSRDEEKLIRVVGNVIFFRYINPAIVVPDAFNVITEQLSLLQRKNLTSISRILLNMSMGQCVSDFYLVPMNTYIIQGHKRFFEFFRRVINEVPTLEEHFGVSEFVEMTAMAQPPVVYISQEEIYYAHWVLKEELRFIVDGSDDPIKEILKELGDPPVEKNLKKGKEIALSLTPRMAKLDEKEIETRTNLIHVKKFAALLIRVQQAPTFLQLLESPTTADDEKKFGQVVMQRFRRPDGSKKRVRTHSISIVELLPPTLAGLKFRCLVLLKDLEAKGLVTRASGFKEILDMVMKDMEDKTKRTRHRMIEMGRMKQSLVSLQEKKDALEAQRKMYMDYLQSCLANQVSAKRRRRLTITSSGSVAPQEEPPSEPVVFYVDKLFAKGVVVELRDVPENQRSKVNITVTQTSKTKFTFVANMHGVNSGKVELRLEDLLESKFNKIPHITLFDGTVKINVNLLVHLLNKRFLS